MKLYATVTSERASKGQGGEWLEIEVQNDKRKRIALLSIYPSGIQSRFTWDSHKLDMDCDGAMDEHIKGNKQKAGQFRRLHYRAYVSGFFLCRKYGPR